MRTEYARRLTAAALLAGIGWLCGPAARAEADQQITILEWRTSSKGEIEVRQRNGEWASRPAPSLPKQAHLVPSLQLWELVDDACQPIVVDGVSIKKMRNNIVCPKVSGGNIHDRQASGFGGSGC